MDLPSPAGDHRTATSVEGERSPLVPGRRLRWYLACEFTLLYAGVPVLLYLERNAFSMRIIPTLLVVAAVCLILLLIDPTFKRRQLLGGGATMIAVSGVTFGAAHLFFANWIAPLLSVFGGILFARTYACSRSTLQPVIEHGLWGDYLFTIGLGWYFYGGSIQG